MKNPWVTFTGMCSLVVGIVLFSIIFGGYSSFVRSQNRIEAAKGLVVEQCRQQLEQVKELAALPGSTEPDRKILLDVSQKTGALIDRLENTPVPLAETLVSEFSTTQSQMNQTVDAFLKRFGQSKATTDSTKIEEKMKAAQTAVFVAGRRYNKEARYYNTRTRVFPGFIVARLFDLDEIYFNEISTDLFKPAGESEAANAS